jgi:hypothetical protein
MPIRLRALSVLWLALMASCATSGAKVGAPVVSGESLRKHVAFRSIPRNTARFEIAIRVGSDTGRVVFDHGTTDMRRRSCAMILERSLDGARIQRVLGDYETPWIDEVGTIDVDADGVEDVFFVAGAGGSGHAMVDGTVRFVAKAPSKRDLVVIATTKLAVVSLSLLQSPEGATQSSYSENWGDARFFAERSFLERIRGAYVSRQDTTLAGKEEDPRHISSTWLRDNGAVEKGPMTIRRFRGKPAGLGSILDEVWDGPVTYFASFRAGVIAYDASDNEHYALFQTRDRYAWPTALARTGPYLVIGTRGEGLAIVDTRSFTLERKRLGSKGDEVATLAIHGTKIRVNDSVEVEAPSR